MTPYASALRDQLTRESATRIPRRVRITCDLTGDRPFAWDDVPLRRP